MWVENSPECLGAWGQSQCRGQSHLSQDGMLEKEVHWELPEELRVGGAWERYFPGFVNPAFGFSGWFIFQTGCRPNLLQPNPLTCSR